MKTENTYALKTVFDAQEAGEALHLSRRTVCRRCAEGYFQGAYREGMRWRIPIDSIESYMGLKQKEMEDINDEN